jgi:hypothetical protein
MRSATKTAPLDTTIETFFASSTCRFGRGRLVRTRPGVLANETSALVRTTNTPELFGGELRILAAGARMRTVEVALSVLD